MAEVTHGQVSYLQLPALDIDQSASFYTEVFGWNFVAEYPESFDSPGGLMGALATDVAVAKNGGPVLWLFVSDIDETLQQVGELGGRVLQAVQTEGPRRQATFSDPGGNVLGVWQNAPT